MSEEKKESLYKYDTSFDRQFPEKSRERKSSGNPLTEEEKKYLTDKYLNEFAKEYKMASLKFGCIDGTEKDNLSKKRSEGLMNLDIEQDSYKLFVWVLEKFDKKYYEGKIANTNTQGEEGSKTIDFFFMADARKKINWHFIDNLKRLKKRFEDGKYTGDVEMDSNDFGDGHENDEQLELIKTMVTEDSIKKIGRYVDSGKEREFISFLIKKKMGFFSEMELIYEYGQDKYNNFCDIVKTLIKAHT